MKMKTLLIVGAISIALATPESLQAQPQPKPVKTEDGNVKEDGQEGGMTGPKFDAAKIKDRRKAAYEKRKKKRGDAKKEGTKVGGKNDRKSGDEFGELVSDDAQVKEV